MHARVISADHLTPALVRVVLGGGDLDRLEMPDATDAYVNVAIAPQGAPYGEVFDPREVKEQHPEPAWPARRRYTVRSWDPVTRLLTIDFVVHGDVGVAGAWAAGVAPGEVLVFEGPSGGYRPDPDADWHLMVGDESALPAIAASLESLPDTALAVVRLVCDGPDHEVPLPTRAALDVVWMHRRGAPDDRDLLAAAVRTLAFPRGRVHAFVHGEAEEIREVRRHLLADRGLSRQDMSCSPYWRRTMTDEAWRAVKRDFVAAMEAEVALVELDGVEPTWAERARTALATSEVATLTAGRCPRSVTVVRIESPPDGHPLLLLGASSPVHRLLAACPVATLAVPGPDPYRALALTGPVLPRRSRDGHRVHRMSLVSARLIGPEVLPIPVTAFLDASPDPLHRHAAATLRHLEAAHAAELLSCLRAHGHRDTRAVVPRGLDRYGLEVAAITDDGVCRMRLPFPGGPVSELGEVAAGLRLLLTCRCRGERA